jgi:acyl dehydratase
MVGPSRGFREFRLGQKFEFQPIVVTEAHVSRFASLSGDFNPNQMDDGFAKNSIFGKRIAHGLLIASLMSGPLGLLLSRTAIALLEVTFEFLHPVLFEDTISREAEVIGLKPSKKYAGGVIKFRVACENAKHERVLTGKFVFLVANNPIG